MFHCSEQYVHFPNASPLGRLEHHLKRKEWFVVNFSTCYQAYFISRITWCTIISTLPACTVYNISLITIHVMWRTCVFQWYSHVIWSRDHLPAGGPLLITPLLLYMLDTFHASFASLSAVWYYRWSCCCFLCDYLTAHSTLYLWGVIMLPFPWITLILNFVSCYLSFQRHENSSVRP